MYSFIGYAFLSNDVNVLTTGFSSSILELQEPVVPSHTIELLNKENRMVLSGSGMCFFRNS